MKAVVITAQKGKREAYWDVLMAGGAYLIRFENFRNAENYASRSSDQVHFFQAVLSIRNAYRYVGTYSYLFIRFGSDQIRYNLKDH